MDRYNLKIIEEMFIRGLEVELTNMRYGESKDKKTVYLYEDELYSFIYIGDIDKLGNKGEFVVRGRITKIEKQALLVNRRIVNSYATCDVNDDFHNNIPQKSPNISNEFRYTLYVDCSSELECKKIKLRLENILDIGPVDMNWNLDDNPKLVPEITELSAWEDLSKYNKDDEFIMSVYNRPHPSIN